MTDTTEAYVNDMVRAVGHKFNQCHSADGTFCATGGGGSAGGGKGKVLESGRTLGGWATKVEAPSGHSVQYGYQGVSSYGKHGMKTGYFYDAGRGSANKKAGIQLKSDFQKALSSKFGITEIVMPKGLHPVNQGP